MKENTFPICLFRRSRGAGLEPNRHHGETGCINEHTRRPLVQGPGRASSQRSELVCSGGR
eukprot:6050561-Alexandrium_andersonii.AAC.1